MAPRLLGGRAMRATFVLLGALLAAPLATGCSSTVDLGPGGHPSADAGGDASEPLPCQEKMVTATPFTPMQGWATPFECTLPAPCPPANLTGNIQGDPLPPVQGTFMDPAAVTCVLTTLRDRPIAQVTFGSISNGADYNEETVYIVSPTLGVSNWNWYQDLGSSSGVRNRQILKPPSYFDGCMQLTDPVQIYNCMSSWSDGCSDTPTTCPGP